MSMIFSIIRIARPSGHRYQKWITYLITVSFACMWAVVLVSKDDTCAFKCQKTMSVALLQLISWFPFLLSIPFMDLKFLGSCSGCRRGYFPHSCASAVLEKYKALKQPQNIDPLPIRRIASYHCHYNPPFCNALTLRLRNDAHHRSRQGMRTLTCIPLQHLTDLRPPSVSSSATSW